METLVISVCREHKRCGGKPRCKSTQCFWSKHNSLFTFDGDIWRCSCIIL